MKLCMTVEEAAEAASVSDEQIRQWANSIDFPSFKIGQRGGKRLIHAEAFNDWLRKQAEMRQGGTIPMIELEIATCVIVIAVVLACIWIEIRKGA